MNGVSNTTRHRVTSPLSCGKVPASVRTNRRTGARAFPRIVAVLLFIAASLGVTTIANAANSVYTPGHYSPANAAWNNETVQPNGDHGMTLSITTTDTTLPSWDVFVNCAFVVGGDTLTLIKVGTVGASTPFSYSNATVCGNQFGNGVTVKTPGAAACGTWTGVQSGYTTTCNKITNTAQTMQMTVKTSPALNATSGEIHVDSTNAGGGYIIPRAVSTGGCTTQAFVSGSPDNDLTILWPPSICNTALFSAVDAMVSQNPVGTWHPGGGSSGGNPTTAFGYTFEAVGDNTFSSLTACTLNDGAIARVARAAGFTGDDLVTAVAVALAESGGNVTAHNHNTSDDSWDLGLWQINNKAHSNYDQVQLTASPYYNATAAHDIYVAATNSFTPWTTYKNASYEKFVSRAITAVNANPTGQRISTCDNTSGDDTTDPATASDECTWTFNIFKILKCAFIPSDDAVKSWQTKMDSITTTPPVSIVVGCVTYAKTFIDIPQSEWDGFDQQHNGMEHGAIGTSGGPIGTVQFDPIAMAGRYQRGDDGYTGSLHFLAMTLYKAAEAIILIFFGWYWFNRVTSSIGGRGV